jgi:hypothetical protein
MLNCGTFICTSCPRSIPIKSSTLMNPGATQELGLDERDGHLWGSPPSRSLIFIVDSDIRSSQHTHKMGSSFRACSRAPLTVLCLRTSLSSFFIIAASGQSPTQCRLWTMRLSTVDQEFSRCATLQGVKLLYLPPYSPDLNPVEEQFAELKALVKKEISIYKENPHLDFGAYLQWCVDMVGGNQNSARGHFWHAGWTIEEPPTGDGREDSF